MLVTFLSRGVSARVPAGATLLDAARLAGVPLEAPCNGSGRCGKCRVRVAEAFLANLSLCPAGAGPDEKDRGVVAACRATVHGDVEVESPVEASGSLRILTMGTGPVFDLDPGIRKIYEREKNATLVCGESAVLAVEPGDTSMHCYGAAVDIGTTTVVVSLIDLNTGGELGTTSFLNPQTRYGHDVLSRIHFASDPEGLETLHSCIVRELTETVTGLASAAGIAPAHIHELVLSGNTCMLHLAAGRDPQSLGRHPYVPAIRGGVGLDAEEMNIALPGACRAYPVPVISGFVGGDIAAGIIATGLHRESGVVLFVDVGTNGEMVLSVDGCLTATSTAAGPAFEGMTIACGMRAADGAIESVRVSKDGHVELGTIGGGRPVGICGSGLVDAVAECVGRGVIDRRGRFADPSGSLPHPLRERMGVQEGRPVFRLAESVVLTQRDIRQVQLAKAAVRAGIDILLERSGLTPMDVDRVLIAGAFGFHLRTGSLTGIGMLPGEVESKVEFVGNTSKTGAQAILLDRATRSELSRLVGGIQVLELADVPEFERTFVEALSF